METTVIQLLWGISPLATRRDITAGLALIELLVGTRFSPVMTKAMGTTP